MAKQRTQGLGYGQCNSGLREIKICLTTPEQCAVKLPTLGCSWTGGLLCLVQLVSIIFVFPCSNGDILL